MSEARRRDRMGRVGAEVGGGVGGLTRCRPESGERVSEFVIKKTEKQEHTADF